MYYLDVLAEFHRRLAPRAYLEIGVKNGRALALARCRAVGVDPAYHITAELDGDVALFRTTSDEYFARPDPLAATGGVPFDLAFIDGLHLFEFALRDFISAERNASARGVIVFDDILPRNLQEAARERHTTGWTGDVFWVLEVLRQYRPDVVAVPLNTSPTGLLVVFRLDPTSLLLRRSYEEIIGRFRRPDPQPVPSALLDRFAAVPPQRFLDSGVLELLAGVAPDADPAETETSLRALITGRLGREFAPGHSG